MHTRAIFILEQKRGKQANSERDRERECASEGALRKDGTRRPS
jgi:hypothetical protein